MVLRVVRGPCASFGVQACVFTVLLHIVHTIFHTPQYHKKEERRHDVCRATCRATPCVVVSPFVFACLHVHIHTSCSHSHLMFTFTPHIHIHTHQTHDAERSVQATTEAPWHTYCDRYVARDIRPKSTRRMPGGWLSRTTRQHKLFGAP